MKTTFSRQFALIAALLLVCMIFTGVSFRFLMLGYLKNDKKETLSADAVFAFMQKLKCLLQI